MTKLFIGNLGFESRLRLREGERVNRSIERIEAELAAVWLAVAEDGDVIQLSEAFESDFFERAAAHGLPEVRLIRDSGQASAGVEVCPWGWTRDVREAAVRHGWNCAAPPHEAVVQANSREFSLRLEQEFDCGLAGAAIVRHPDELQPALTHLPDSGRWVLKANWSSSARDRFLGTGRVPTPQALGWLSHRLKTDGCAILEPWVRVSAEAGLQFSLPCSPNEPPRLEGVTPTLTDAWGRYRGSRFHHDAECERTWAPAVDAGFRVLEQLRAIGYFGPVGLDAARYFQPGHAGEARLRPIQEINGRWTMGRLALGFRRLLEPGQCGSWLHVRRRDAAHDRTSDWLSEIEQQSAAGTRAIVTSPRSAGGRSVRHLTILLTAGSTADLDTIEQRVLEAAREDVPTESEAEPR